MKPYTVSVSVTVEQPPAVVHALLDELAAHRRWTDHFLVDWTLSGPARGVGAKARFRGKGQRNGWMEVEVTEVTPTRIVEHGRSGKGMARRTTGTYELAPAPGGGTAVTFTNVVEPVNRLDALGAPVAKAYLRRQNARALERLREVLAEDATAGPAPVAGVPAAA